MLNHPGPERNSHRRITRQSTSGRYRNSESQPSGDVALIFRIAMVAIAIIITHPSMAHVMGVSAPRMRNKPKTNSTVETSRVLNSGKGTCAATKVSRICSRCSGTKSLPRPERKNNKPTASRAMRIPIHSHACRSVRNIRIHDMPRESTDNDRLAITESMLVQSDRKAGPPFWKTKLWPARVSEGYRLVVPELWTLDAGKGSGSYF